MPASFLFERGDSMSIKNIGIKNITVNFDEHELQDLVIVQGDTGTRGFRVTLNDNNGELIPASSQYELRLYGVNSNYPDKTYFTVSEIEGTNYIARISTDMASAKGRLSIQLALFEGTERLAQTRIWELEVNKSIAQGGEVGKDLVVDFTLLTETIADVKKLRDEYAASLVTQEAIESDVTQMHSEVTVMHTELQDVFETENARVEAEAERKDSERARKDAEEERAGAETARKDAETDRAGKEAARQSAEAGRVGAENARSDNEAQRIEDENARLDSEKNRNDEEVKRKNNEVDREDNEVIREQNEAERITKQSARDTTWDAWQDLIEDGILPPATPTIAGAVKIDAEGADTAVSVDTLNTELAKKVDVIAGKGLSTNDYTDDDKDKLAGIESGANKYVHPETHSLDEITETSTKKIMTSAERTKLDGLSNYTHPSSHDASMITESTSRRFVSDAEKTSWNAKIGSHGSITIEQIAVISAGGSTADIPNGTLILELE